MEIHTIWDNFKDFVNLKFFLKLWHLRFYFTYPSHNNLELSQISSVIIITRILLRGWQILQAWSVCLSVRSGTWLIFGYSWAFSLLALCVCEVQRVSRALSQLRLVFVFECRADMQRYEWTCSAPKFTMNCWVQLPKVSSYWGIVSSAGHRDSWLLCEVFKKTHFP